MTSRRGLVVARCVVAGRSQVRGRVESGLLLSRVATAHTGGRARGGYPLGVGKGREGREEGKVQGKAGSKGRLGVRAGWNKKKQILGPDDTRQYNDMELTSARTGFT